MLDWASKISDKGIYLEYLLLRGIVVLYRNLIAESLGKKCFPCLNEYGKCRAEQNSIDLLLKGFSEPLLRVVASLCGRCNVEHSQIYFLGSISWIHTPWNMLKEILA